MKVAVKGSRQSGHENQNWGLKSFKIQQLTILLAKSTKLKKLNRHNTCRSIFSSNAFVFHFHVFIQLILTACGYYFSMQTYRVYTVFLIIVKSGIDLANSYIT